LSTLRPTIKIADAFASFLPEGFPLRVRAFDGSVAGPSDAEVEIELLNDRGLAYILTAPGDLGMGRAWVAGDLVAHGVHPGNPYPLMSLFNQQARWRKPNPAELVRTLTGLGLSHLKPPPPPPQEHLPRWRRVVEGLRHSKTRDAEVIHHHYDVSNRFYEMVLGPSMTYTCAVFPSADATLEEAQATKYDLVARKLDLQPGQRLLDVGCGWGGMVRHAAREYGVKALGVTLSLEQAEWAKQAIDREGLGDLAEVRHLDYRDVVESEFDAVSSIGLTEHIGVRNYPAYFSFLRDRVKVGGRILNHCITRPHNRPEPTGTFIDRYVFPDGELTGVGRITTVAQDAGLEVHDVENLRIHYAMTLKGWSENLEANWDECVSEVGEGTARVWGLYMVGSRIAFERHELELDHVLASRTADDGTPAFPLRPTW
jgi:cyclopropane-fatty-acyl-phospholipid synthase